MAQPYVPPCQRGFVEAEPCPQDVGRVSDVATKRWVLAACVLASSMAFIDGSALTVALPQLTNDLGAGLREVQWVLNAYVLALAALTLIGGALADRYGRAYMLAIGCVVFAVASIACALSPTVEALITARFAQGVGAAIVTPASLALIGETYPKEERSGAIGVWAAASALTTAGGPLLGGWLTETYGWEAVFWMNPPLAAIAVYLLWRHAPAGTRKDTRFDSLGALLLALALAALAYAVSNLAPNPEAPPVAGDVTTGTETNTVALSLAGVGLGLLVTFVVQQSRSDHAMVPGRMLQSSGFLSLNIATLLIYAGLSLMFFLLPFELIDRRGLSPTQAGLALLPFTLAVACLSQPAGQLADRLGARPLLIAGPIFAAIGFVLLAWLQSASFLIGVLVPIAISGLGFSLLVSPLTAAVMSSVPDEDTGLASGINNTASRVAQLLGVALAAGVAPLASGFSTGLYVAAGLCFVGAASLFGAPRR